MEQLAFERDAAPERARSRNLYLALAAVLVALMVTAIAATEAARLDGHASPNTADHEPALGRPGRRF